MIMASNTPNPRVSFWPIIIFLSIFGIPIGEKFYKNILFISSRRFFQINDCALSINEMVAANWAPIGASPYRRREGLGGGPRRQPTNRVTLSNFPGTR
jgi:hypothetical protein